MTRARDLANIISGGFTADDIPNLDAAKITSGTFADARIAASNVSQHATSFDDNKIVNDISTLGLRVHTQENLNASNTNSASFDVFQDSSAISNLTNCSRDANEFIASVVVASESGGTETTWGTLSEGSSYFSLSGGLLRYTASNSYNFSCYRNAILSGNYWLRWKTSKGWSNSGASPPSGNDSPGLQVAIDYNDDGSRGTTNSIWNRNDNNFFWFGSRGNASSSNRHDYMRGQTRQATTTQNGDDSEYYYFVRDASGSGTLKIYRGDYATASNLLHTYSGYSGTQTDAFGFAIGYPSNESTNTNNVVADNISYKTGITTLAGTTSANATGSFTGNNITASSSTNKMGAVITYQDNAGTNTLNTDIVLQLSADGGSNYSTATMTALPDFATGIKMAKVNDLSVTAGTSINYKISFANQASGSKEARIRGVSLQY
jgi:hypothetical protein